MHAAKSLAFLARWNVDPLWASSRAIARLLLTPFRFQASRGQWVKRECPGTRLECALSSNKNRTCKRQTSTRECGPRLLRVHDPRTSRPENSDVICYPARTNDFFVCFMRLPKPLRFDHCLGPITSHCSVKEPVLLPRESGGDHVEIVPNNCLVVWILCRIFEIFSSFVLRHFFEKLYHLEPEDAAIVPFFFAATKLYTGFSLWLFVVFAEQCSTRGVCSQVIDFSDKN